MQWHMISTLDVVLCVVQNKTMGSHSLSPAQGEYIDNKRNSPAPSSLSPALCAVVSKCITSTNTTGNSRQTSIIILYKDKLVVRAVGGLLTAVIVGALYTKHLWKNNRVKDKCYSTKWLYTIDSISTRPTAQLTYITYGSHNIILSNILCSPEFPDGKTILGKRRQPLKFPSIIRLKNEHKKTNTNFWNKTGHVDKNSG